jgi:hypothetical protein
MSKTHWYEWAHRWNQVNCVETDPRDCDLEVWREYWKKNNIQGTIVNAAGTVGYYPSSNPYQYRAKYLGGRDFFADFCKAAREEGLVVAARMDSNQAAEELFEIHPQWFCKDKDGKPLRQTPHRYYTCINGDYYTEQLSSMIREIIDRYHPDAFADNTITGPRGIICYCENCKRKFREYSGLDIPKAADFSDRTFRIWLKWNQMCRVERYRWFNTLSVKYGGEDCIYMGMFKDAYSKGVLELVMDDAEYAEFNKAIMIDGQIRTHSAGFDANALQGLAMHETFGDKTLLLESVATYTLAPNMERKSANTVGETESWMRAAMIGGICPSTHFIGGVQEDKRALKNGEAMFDWQKKNEDYLFNRSPVSNVALVRSFRNTCYYGQNDSHRRIDTAMNGMIAALKLGRIPFLPIDTRQIAAKAHRIKVMILPEIAVLTDAEHKSIGDYIRNGGSIVFTGATGMLDDLGYPLKVFPLDGMFGMEREEKEPLDPSTQRDALAGLGDYGMHNYIRIAEPRHEIFSGFEETAIISLHGTFYKVKSPKLHEIAHMVPAFPTYPPETSYMEDGRRTSVYPGILAGETGFGGRVVYFAADYDRKYGETYFKDYGTLLKNAVLWAMGDAEPPLRVTGKGELDCKLFFQKQDNRYILQILNHSGLGKWPGSVEEFFPVGPEKITVSVGGLNVQKVYARNLEQAIPFTMADGKISFTLDCIHDQELIVIS